MMLIFMLFTACNEEKHAEEVAESYQQGVEEGYQDGYEDGQNQGFQLGYDTGTQAGFQTGYEEGYQEGYTDATTVPSGWELYAQGNYTEACSSFLYEASDAGLSANNATGLGWCHLRQSEFAVALSWFDMAIALDESYEDAWVGFSSVSMLMHSYQDAIDAIDQVLILNPTYISTVESIDASSLHTAHVLAHLFQRNSAAVAISLAELDPTHDLQPLNRSSWVVDGTAYSSFQHAVIAKLQLLGAI